MIPLRSIVLLHIADDQGPEYRGKIDLELSGCEMIMRRGMCLYILLLNRQVGMEMKPPTKSSIDESTNHNRPSSDLWDQTMSFKLWMFCSYLVLLLLLQFYPYVVADLLLLLLLKISRVRHRCCFCRLLLLILFHF